MPTRTIKAIFYTRFHHEKGSRVLHQVPAGAITPSTSPSALSIPLFSFSSVTSYLIPTQQFCDRLLTFCVNHNRVIGYPVCIREGKYSRNEFIFNFAVVIGENEKDWACYGEVVRKLGKLLRGLEEQGGFLSREEDDEWEDDGCLSGGLGVGGGLDEVGFGVGGGSKVHALCEMVLEDLNNYAECMIPIDDSNTINLKLFPTRPPPPPILAHQVPLLTISLSSLQTPISSDLTLNRILPYINGINAVAHIAQLADTDLSLTRRAIQHLVYYGCLVLLDIFSFSAIYAPTAEISSFVNDADMKEECLRYVRVPQLHTDSAPKPAVDKDKEKDNARSPPTAESLNADNNDSTTSPSDPSISHLTLITLYTSLRQGLPLKTWVLQSLPLLCGIDIRRLITFGIIKGFLYRVHKYGIATISAGMPPAPPTSVATSIKDADVLAPARRNTLVPPVAAAHAHHPSFSLHRPSVASTATLGPRLDEEPRDGSEAFGAPAGMQREREREEGLPLLRFLDGMHCFDEVCCEVRVAERVVEGRVKGGGEGLGLGVIVHR
ncbi:NPR2-domain-containing protein [Dothidotthia symphoricarpi CBS 119687]|uniref:NPR2-domain-containing protein n=1 Tax=Dothidotthia symphoricarpi CBS 119687 TaxID=1392245 RepID=A0A6A6AAN1_9PLEO|nr:NPR2-domain-containing protein [Dothidotthia symphoricarpi CBS 119687]KAF2127938.1 NPR2-domain-containing protein [Dothidotthia symphoricarpi CBS 119687]